MKIFASALIIPVLVASAHGGVAQSSFQKVVSGVSYIEVFRTRGQVVLFSSSDPKKIAEIVNAFELVDPQPKKSADGEDLITLPCFCVAEYVVSFSIPSGDKKVFGLKHSVSAVLPPEHLDLGYLTDIDLSKRSSKRLKRMIHRWEKEANQAAQTTPGLRVADR